MHGLDRASAPSAAQAKAMLNEIGGSWWAVYIGGPRRASASWTPAVVEAYKLHGVDSFLLVYVGRQVLLNGRPPNRQIDDRRLLTTAQGKIDGADAVRDADAFGFGRGSPIALDLELETFQHAPRGSIAYICGWCEEVRAQGRRPGLYTNKPTLVELNERPDGPDWVWIAKWVTHLHDSALVTRPIRDFSNSLWATPGQRCWQYAGNLGPDKLCTVGGLQVDINVADSDCLVGAAGAAMLRAQPVPKEDDMVIMITAPAKAPRAIVGSKLIGFQSAADRQSFIAACEKADVPIIDWQCSVAQYNATSGTFGA
jgi:hypothetical protein